MVLNSDLEAGLHQLVADCHEDGDPEAGFTRFESAAQAEAAALDEIEKGSDSDNVKSFPLSDGGFAVVILTYGGEVTGAL